MALINELGPDGEPVVEGQDVSGAPGTSQNAQQPPQNELQPDPSVPQPTRPPASAPKINSITTGPLFGPAKAIETTWQSGKGKRLLLPIGSSA